MRCGGLFATKEQCAKEDNCCYDPSGSLFEKHCFHSHQGPSPPPTPPSGSGLDMFVFGSEGEKAWSVTNDPVTAQPDGRAEMATYFIAFADMTQSYRGQKEGGPPTKAQLKAITRLGFNDDGKATSTLFWSVSSVFPEPRAAHHTPCAVLHLVTMRVGC